MFTPFYHYVYARQGKNFVVYLRDQSYIMQNFIKINNIQAASHENLSSGFPIRSDTNRAVQPQMMARGLKVRIYEVEVLYYLCSENKGADQLS